MSSNNDDMLHHVCMPVRTLLRPEHITLWERSPAYSYLMDIIVRLSVSVKNRKLTDVVHLDNATVNALLAMLKDLDALVTATPPDDTMKNRFGNKEFRKWFLVMSERSVSYAKSLLPSAMEAAHIELIPYILDSFGNPTRIDYGTGHESTFVLLLSCLVRLNVLSVLPQGNNDSNLCDGAAIVLKVFVAYLRLVRRIQMTYRLEPAGSHGVWGLDDHQFISYIFGAAQLVGNLAFKPKCYTDVSTAKAMAEQYLFFDCIDHINTVKTGPFFEHSPMLWDISGAASWEKVYKGLIKMYPDEVLRKFPVVQHFVFGSLLQCDTGTSAPAGTESPLEKTGPFGTRGGRDHGVKNNAEPIRTTMPPIGVPPRTDCSSLITTGVMPPRETIVSPSKAPSTITEGTSNTTIPPKPEEFVMQHHNTMPPLPE